MEQHNAHYRLLAVDDNSLNLGVFRLFLTQLGHDVTAVNDPFNAIELANTEHYDLIFTDLQMPGMSGIELSRELRANNFSGPIIAITAHLSPAEENQIRTSDLNDVMIKPVTKQDLMRTLKTHLETSKSTAGIAKVLNEVRSAKPIYDSAANDSGSAYDVELALSRASGSVSLAEDLLALLMEGVEDTLSNLDQELDPSEVANILHKLAGGVRFSGAVQLEAALANAQSNLERGQYTVTHTRSLLISMKNLIDWVNLNPKPFSETLD